MRQLAVNVRPEFFDDDGNGVVAELGSPHTGGIGQGPIRGDETGAVGRLQDRAGRVISVGRDAGRDGAA